MRHERFWNPRMSPCVPSDHRSEHLRFIVDPGAHLGRFRDSFRSPAYAQNRRSDPSPPPSRLYATKLAPANRLR
eukprot:6180779-Prymnesium_polylepis.1